MSSVNADMSSFNVVLKQLKAARNKKLQVGWFDSAKYDDNTPVAGVAAANEFGNPPRPFIRNAIEDNKTEWSSVVEDGFKSGADANTVLSALGLTVQADIKLSIVNGDYAPLADATLAARRRRGNTNNAVLRDTSRMIDTITYELGDK